uniref:Odorant receptor n=1 Tax=Helicoverpa armigera TaxID=29058 RepID=A0A075T629_HELAM|nr:odorant receptor [Helicoverpa armigera]
MNRPIPPFKENAMTKFLDELNTIFFLVGLTDLWISEVKFSKRFIKIYKKINYFMDFLCLFFVVFLIGSYFTQKDLTEKLANDRLMFSIILPGNLVFYYICIYYKEEIRNLLYHLTVVLKEQHNDTRLEREMIRKIRVFSITLNSIAFVVDTSYGFGALYEVVTKGENFNTIVPAWPDVHDNSSLAGAMRVFFYFCWLNPIATRVLTTFSLLLTEMVAVCYQFRNLQSYFYSLDDIFSDDTLSQKEKEIKYEDRFKIGIRMHIMTLWCKKLHQHVNKEILAIEMVLFFAMLMSELTTLLGGERNASQLCMMFLISVSTCISLGFFMWNGGDITIEASKISEAMYSSGWQNCRGNSSVRMRKLVTFAIKQAQDPVVYKTVGVVDLSHTSYVTLVKMPYSAVSVLY